MFSFHAEIPQFYLDLIGQKGQREEHFPIKDPLEGARLDLFFRYFFELQIESTFVMFPA